MDTILSMQTRRIKNNFFNRSSDCICQFLKFEIKITDEIIIKYAFKIVIQIKYYRIFLNTICRNIKKKLVCDARKMNPEISL